MFCYKCGCELGQSDHCPNCGADVATYKSIIYTSNQLYNEGLEKAKVKDLSGAILCLKQSLWCNKDNLDARNLLGLVYFEIGEPIAAFSEWVISQSINNDRLHQDNNAADRYLEQFQNGSQMVDDINTAITRYNHALECCYADNLDVAILQLKKVLQLNSHYLRARQLLALIYISNKQWKRAEKELNKCMLLDVNNTTTLRYMQEVQNNLFSEQSPEESLKRRNKSNKKNGSGIVKYKTDNETIIQPVGTRAPGVDGFRLPLALTAGVIGLIIGAAVFAFMVMPARIQSIRQESASQVEQITSQTDAKDAEISQLQSQIAEITAAEEVSEELPDNAKNRADAIINAITAYIADPTNIDAVAEALVNVDPSEAVNDLPETYAKLYQALFDKTRDTLLAKFSSAGISAYEATPPDYAETIKNLDKAMQYDNVENPSQDFPKMLFYLGDSYYRAYNQGNNTQQTHEYQNYIPLSKAYLSKLVHDYPSSIYTESAQAILNSIPEAVEAAEIFSSASAETDETAGTLETADGEEQTEAGETADAGAVTATETTDAGAVTAPDTTAAETAPPAQTTGETADAAQPAQTPAAQ